MYHHVERPFVGEGVQRLRGEAVNPEGWRNGKRLVGQRFLSAEPVTEKPTPCACGRMWVGEVREHGCPGAKAETPRSRTTQPRGAA